MNTKQQWLSCYGVAIALTVIALLLSLCLESLITRTIGSFFYVAITVSSWYGGKRSGVTAIILSLLLIDYFLIPPVHQIQISNFDDVLRLSLIAIVGMIITSLSASLQQSKQIKVRQNQLLQQKQTSRDETENLLRQLEVERHRLEQILRQMPFGVVIAEAPTGKLLFHNDEAVRLLRHPLLDGDTYQSYAQYGAVHADRQPYRPDEYPIARSLLSGAVIKAEEMQYRRGDGTDTIFSVSAAPIINLDRQVIAVVGTFEDINDRKQAEQAVAKEFLRIQTLFNTALDGIVILDEQGSVLDANQRFAEMLGYTLEEIATLSVFDWDAQFTPEVIQQFAQDSLIQRIGIFETQHRRKDGSIYDVEISYNVVEWDSNILRFCSCRDISERKRMEAERYQWQIALQRQEASYRQMFENNPQPMWVYDLETLQFLAVNSAAIVKYGYSEAEFLSMTITDIRPSQDVPRLIENVRQISGGLDHAGNWEHQLKNGSLITVEIISHTLEFSERRAELVLVNDITERKLVEEALQRSELRFRQMAMAAPSVIFTWVFHPEQGARFEYLNPYFERLHEISITEALADYNVVVEQIHPDDREQYLQTVAHCAETLHPFQHEWRIITPSGKVKWLYASAELEVRDNGEIAWHGVGLDLSGRKQAELALQDLNQSLEQKIEERTTTLQESQQLLQTVLDTTPIPIFWKDRQSIYQGVNAVAAQNLGLESASDCVGLSDAQLPWLPEDAKAFQQEDLQVMESGQSVLNQAYHLWLQDGTELWFEISKVPLRDTAGNVIGVLGIAPDITERKRTEIALQNLNERLSLSLKAGGFGTWSLDLVSGAAVWDERMYELFGMQNSGQPLTHQDWSDLVHPDEIDWLESNMQALIRGEGARTVEYRICHPDGKLHWLQGIAIAQCDAEGNPIQILGLNRDITDRKQVEESLRQSEATNRALMESIPDLLVRMRQDGLHLQVFNQGAIHTLTAEVPLDQSKVTEILPEVIAQERIALAKKAIQTGQNQQQEYHFVDQGKTFYEEARISPLNSNEVLVVVRDITDLKRVERELQESQQFIQQIADASPNILYLYDVQQQRNVYSNHEITSVLGYSPDEIQAMSSSLFQSIMHPDDLARLPAQQERINRAQDHEIIDFEYRMRHSNGEWRWLYSRDAVFRRDEGGQVQQVIGTAQDITHLKQIQQLLNERNQQLAVSNQELARATRLKDEFLANMSHELRTPLNAILGMSEGLQDGILGEINQQQLEALQVIERSGSHLLNLINDILDLARIESGQNELNCTPTNLQLLCKSSIEFVKQQALKKQIQIQLKCPFNLPNLVMDERRILQVLVNLLNNAVKFTPNNGQVTLEVSLPVLQKEGEEHPWLRLMVQDTGIGIEPRYIPKLFQSFVQIDSALNRRYEGTGLGLALVKRIVEQHGGRVGLTSESGVGSCFIIDLPYIVAQSPMSRLPLQLGTDLKSDQSGQTTAPLILLVEDNEANALMIINYLQFKGHRLLVAREGQEAIAMTQAERPDLILMDIQMPGMDGIEAIKQIRRLPDCGKIPIIALTALAMDGDREQCLAAGASDYLSKPVQLKQLVAKIQQFLSAYQPE